MNSNKKYKIIIILVFMSLFSICNGQNTNEEETLIIGTWVAEGSNLNDKWIFTTNQILEEYTDNSLDITYTWTITSNVNSGIVSHFLEVVNINDSSDKYNYEISIVNNERLVLIYQRGNGMGIGKPSIYFRQ